VEQQSRQSVGNNRRRAASTEASAGSGRLDEQLCFALYAAGNAMTRSYRPLLGELGLTYPQYLVLLTLWEHGSRQMGEIAESLHLATHAVSPIVDRLEDAGLARRSRDRIDGRIVNVALTGTGAELEAAAAAVQDQMRCRTNLSPSAVSRLRAELIALVDALDDASTTALEPGSS
jgi:DNA-binding MarR family transcriptional regulator